MTAKEKAQELITKFSPLVTTWDCYWDVPRQDEDVVADAKQCALITVDEIKEILDFELGHDQTARGLSEYYDQVKAEIEKL
jgi:hypothetical protein